MGKGSPPLWLAVVEAADGRWGVVSRAELRALGLSARLIDAWVGRGRLRRLHRGVYAVGHAALRVEGRRLAAVLACGPGAVLSHTSAAAQWGLLGTAKQRIDVTAPRGKHGAPGIRLHRSRSVDARDTTTHEAIPITTVARTLLDLAATVRSSRLERALAQAMRNHLYDQRALEDAAERANGHRGRGILQRAIAREPKLTRSDFEARLLARIRAAGLPEPLANHSLAAFDHVLYEVDLYWPSHQLIVELDDWETHRTRAAFERDRRKDAALIATGYRALRFTWRSESDAAEVIARVQALTAGTHPPHG